MCKICRVYAWLRVMVAILKKKLKKKEDIEYLIKKKTSQGCMRIQNKGLPADFK